MDALPFIKEMLSKPALRVFLSDNDPVHLDDSWDAGRQILEEIDDMNRGDIRVDNEDERRTVIECLRLHARKVGVVVRNTQTRISWGTLVNQWTRAICVSIDTMVSCNYWNQTKWNDMHLWKILRDADLEHNINIDAVINYLHDIQRIEELLPDRADSSNSLTNKEKSRALLLMTAFPALHELIESPEMLGFLLRVSKELDNLPELICEACEGQPLALLLIGSLLSLKPMAYNPWKEVKDVLVNIKESDNGATNNFTWHILTYCFHDLPFSLQLCFLYVACYPIDYEIPARSLTEIWIAENFVQPENGETSEETANKYLEQLVKRSLICVSKRSFLGTFKRCRVRQIIHEFAIKESCKDGFLVANPDEEKLKSVQRFAIHLDNQKHYTVGVNINHIRSFLAFDFDRNVFGTSTNLKVLELGRSTIPETGLVDMIYLRYLGLRGSKICELPKNIGDMTSLQTLDVKDTNIETLPESLWNISTLRHVYVNPSPKIKGPPSTANISDLQILKTIAVHESWLKNFPKVLIKLTKLALSNKDNPYGKSNPYWKSISNLLSHMSNLLSMTIIGDILPSEFADLRAFPKLGTVKSMKLEGQWISRTLPIDNVEFPANLAKLTLTKSGLKNDPMPRLEKLEALKYLSLQDGAYDGEKMVCSANGFPVLQILELKKLVNLKNLEVEPKAMSQLAMLRVVLCPDLKRPRHLENVSIEGIDN